MAQVRPEALAKGTIYPPLRDIREVAVHVAKAVAHKAYENGYASALPKPHNLYEVSRQLQFSPRYTRYM
jgi:malate dehydrogenase (oxaloacetate-decarboxylating)(NADP+)